MPKEAWQTCRTWPYSPESTQHSLTKDDEGGGEMCQRGVECAEGSKEDIPFVKQGRWHPVGFSLTTILMQLDLATDDERGLMCRRGRRTICKAGAMASFGELEVALPGLGGLLPKVTVGLRDAATRTSHKICR